MDAKLVVTKTYSLFDRKTHQTYHVVLTNGDKILCPSRAVAKLVVRAINNLPRRRQWIMRTTKRKDTKITIPRMI